MLSSPEGPVSPHQGHAYRMTELEPSHDSAQWVCRERGLGVSCLGCGERMGHCSMEGDGLPLTGLGSKEKRQGLPQPLLWSCCRLCPDPPPPHSHPSSVDGKPDIVLPSVPTEGDFPVSSSILRTRFKMGRAREPLL